MQGLYPPRRASYGQISWSIEEIGRYNDRIALKIAGISAAIE